MNLGPLRHSQLKKMAKSPRHFLSHQERAAKWLDKGSGAHSAILGGKRLAVWDKLSDKGNQCPRRGKDYDAFEAENKDALILLPDEYEQVARMAEAVQNCPDALRVLEGVREKTILWDAQGRICRGTPDVDGGSFVTELKTTKDANPRKFQWDSLRFCYHGALAWYQDGLTLQPGRREIPSEAYIVAVESFEPHDVVVYQVPERALEAGRRANRLWFEMVRQCEESGQFPGYSQSVVELGFPESDDIEIVGAEEEAA